MSKLSITQMPTKNFTKAASRRIDLVVIHTIEIDERPDSAEACGKYFQTTNNKVSAHYCVDNNSIVQCVQDKDVAWAAPFANSDGIQIEHAGRARQTAKDWADKYSVAVLDISARLVADLCKKYAIPSTFLFAPGLAAGMRGITTHWQVSRAFGGSHWDPGYGFPIDEYIALVKKYRSGPQTGSPAVKDTQPTLKLGAKGWRVKQLQRLLNLAKQKITVDGNFGEWTEKGVKAFQKRAGLKVTGVVNEATWRALWTNWLSKKEES